MVCNLGQQNITSSNMIFFFFLLQYTFIWKIRRKGRKSDIEEQRVDILAPPAIGS